MTAPALLPLDGDRWGTLRHAYGPAVDTPGALRVIEADPDVRCSESLARTRQSPTPWEHVVVVVHQQTIYSATYAALPHLVRIAAGRPDPVMSQVPGALPAS